jgi:formyltetrahydrofolate-dependent phosphoribosylglycinamide formyltransferase
MFQGLMQKWKVNGTQLFLIICVFAVTGTTTAYLTRQITRWLELDSSSAWYWILKVLMLVFGYQVLILLFAIPFGQFRFFWNYEKKILRRMGLMRRSRQQKVDKSQVVIKVAIFASGAGSNAQKIIDHFRNHPSIKIALIVCNKPGAGVLTIAERENIPSLLIEKEKFFRGNAYTGELKEKHIDFIILAGFLWKVPTQLIAAYPQRIVNIHPALLPNYGGKGMYGNFVHEAVIAANDKQSGISIHYVDELYDHGKLIFQATCDIEPAETAGSLAQKIHALEHAHYPVILEKVLLELQNRS